MPIRDNVVTFAGNATREPELRFTNTGRAFASFGLAINESWTNRDGQKEERTSFVDITAWGQLGENVAESVAKGARVVVVGRLEQRNWETSDGEKRSKLQVVADDVSLSLVWATAAATKNARREGGSHPQQSQSSSPAGSSDEYVPYNPSEEPF